MEHVLLLLVGLGLILPAGVVVALSGVLAFRAYARRVGVSEHECLVFRRRRRTFWLGLCIAAVVQSISTALVGGPYEEVARIVSIQPGSAIFYLIPRAATDILPEIALLFVGAGTELCISFVIVVGILSLVPHKAGRERAA